jgi:hypothetical protein
VIEIDYIFDAATVDDACRGGTITTDYSLPEWEMQVRLRVGDVEVLGHTEEEDQQWMEELKRHQAALIVPSSAWTLLEVVSIAASVDSACQQLQAAGRGVLVGIEQDIWLERRADDVLITFRHDRVGRAPAPEVYDALMSFAQRVRQDFLSACPVLRDHVTLGWWFRGEDRPPATEGHVIHLPAADPPTDDH